MSQGKPQSQDAVSAAAQSPAVKSAKSAAAARDAGRTPREVLGITDEQFEEMGQLGVMFYTQGDLERARIAFEGLVQADPNSSSAHSALGALYTRTGRYDEALEQVNRAIELNSDQLEAYVNRAEIWFRKNQMQRAVEDIKRAMSMDPGEKDPAANRARVMLLGLHQALKARGIMT